MRHPLEARSLTKTYGDVTALAGIDLRLDRPSIVGLIGRNGSGKTSLFRQAVGLSLPSSGSMTTLGCRSDELGPRELARIGYSPQELRFLDWMSVEQHVRYVASFYDSWDTAREAHLRRELELPADTQVGALSSGDTQKLALVLATCHHPELLLLDEPVSDLDPIVRERLLGFLLTVLADDEATIVVSSHILRDIESIVDHVVCLDHGSVVADQPLDELTESYAEWRVTSADTDLPAEFAEPFVLRQRVEGRTGVLLVRAGADELAAFRASHPVAVAATPLSLERLFPLLLDGRAP